MNILTLVPPAEGNVIRDVLYGCWCRGRRIGGGTIPPLSLLSVATTLKQRGHSVRLIDAPEEKKALKDIETEIEGIGLIIILTSSMSFKDDVALLGKLKKKNPRLITSMFGSHPTFLPKICLERKEVDILVRYEPEFVYRDLADKLSKESGLWKKVKGIAFRDGDSININEPYPFIDHLDELPVPDRSLLSKGMDYFNPIIKRTPYTTSVTSRGCPGKCTFCTAPAFTGNKVRHNSARHVMHEIEYLLSLGFREIYYRDETFSFFNSRNEDICRSIIDKKLDVSWICNIKSGTIKKNTLALMKQAGCHTIKIGVESGVQDILDRSKKGIKLEDTRTLFRWARELGISTHAHVMLGMPGEDKNTIKRTVDFVISLDPATVDFGICTPYPGTPLFDTLIEEHKELKDKMGIDWDTLHVSGYLNKYFTGMGAKELEKAIFSAYRRFYMRPGYILSWLGRIFSDAKAFRKVLKAGYNIILFCLIGEEKKR
ncbi:MAG: radical SAM protein [Candidatus Omnitrophica bacterium]|nr:radical SAM protein [Candidatus Omnitrophota bacterium]